MRAVTQIGAGASHSVALVGDDAVLSWGKGEDGQLGHGLADQLLKPAQIMALKGKRFKQVVCGAEHTIALEKDTTGIHSWGWGDFGRLGHGDSDDQFLPRPIKALASQPIAFVACGDSHSMFITPAGELLCCGRNQEGELGLGHNDDVRVPTRIPALKDEKIAGVACGAEHTVACTEGGALFAWGWGGYGNLGLGTTENQSSPCPVPGVSDIKSVACGWRHSCGIDGKGNLIVFGWNKYGQLGIGSFEHSLRAVAVEKIKQVKKVSGGWRHTAALTADGKLYCWGWNRFGQVGAGDQADKNEPTLVPKFAAAEVTDVVCGWRHTICITAENSVFSWGRGSDGQLGTGVAVDNLTPQLIREISGLHVELNTLETQEAGTGYIPPDQRYSVVPEQDGTVLEVPDIPMPPGKRAKIAQ